MGDLVDQCGSLGHRRGVKPIRTTGGPGASCSPNRDWPGGRFVVRWSGPRAEFCLAIGRRWHWWPQA
jgi:hypothetical protein